MALLNGGAIRVSGRLTANEPGVAKASVLEGQGIAHLPSAAASGELKTGMLTPVLPELIGADIPSRSDLFMPAGIHRSASAHLY